MLQQGEDDGDERSVREALKNNPTDWVTVIMVLLRRPDLVSLRQRYRKYTPLHSAVAECKSDYVSLLLRLGGDADAKDAFGFTPLATAANADTECAATAGALLRAGRAAPFPQCGSRGSPLHGAALRGHARIAALLLAWAPAGGGDGGALDFRDWRGCTALDVAREHRHHRVAALIEQAGGASAGGDGAEAVAETAEGAEGAEGAVAVAVAESAAVTVSGGVAETEQGDSGRAGR